MPSQKDEHGYTPENYQPLPNKEAIIHFNGKTLLTSESYLDVKAYEHALAFTVAGLMDKDLLKDVRDGIKSALENGEDFRTFKQRLKPYLMAKGWLAETLDDGTQQLVAGSNRRLRTIYSTNLQTAYSAGQWSRIQQTKEFLPYLQYMPSVSENPRLSHKHYYGLCREATDSIWQSIMPPNGWGCKCWVKQLTKRQAQKVGISDETPLETEEYTNPKTGQTSDVPVGIDPSFNHNFDRLTALFKLANDKHGKEFANKLGDNLKDFMLKTVVNNGVSMVNFASLVPRPKEVERLINEGVRDYEAELTDQWQQYYEVDIVGYQKGVHKVLIEGLPADLAEVDNDLPPMQWKTLDIMFKLSDKASISEFNRSFVKSDERWENSKDNIIKHLNKADIVPMYLDNFDNYTLTRVMCFVLSLTKEQRKQIVLIAGK